ncbi:MAG: DUF3450 domain-containing protein [Gammaproteobacteria bacterium]|nr:DUF3450 domain-containing protein [Gammaproteobacteria bacterium]
MRVLVLLVMAFTAVTAWAQTPGEAIAATLRLNQEALDAQQRIDRLFEQRQRIQNEISTIELEGTTFALRNSTLAQQLADTRQNLAEIETDIHAITETQTGIITLLDKMIDALERFIVLDLPFQQQQRHARIASLRGDLVRSDLSVSNKYQAVISAYLDEIRLGFTNSVTTEQISTSHGDRTMQILRLGRAGLWYVTADGRLAGRWDPRDRVWTDDNTDPQEVIKGIRIVQELAAPDVVKLPLRLDIP